MLQWESADELALAAAAATAVFMLALPFLSVIHAQWRRRRRWHAH